MQYEDKYLNRVTSQHKIQPKYMAWMAALLDKLQDLADVAHQIDRAFDIDAATGVQLDTIGQLVGVSRLLDFEPHYAPSALLSDDDYRLILRARISLNQWDGTTEGIYRIWGDIFPDARIEVVDNQDMTMSIRVFGVYNDFASEYISHGYAAPKPEGVGVNYVFLLMFTVETDLYIGAKVANARTHFDLLAKPAPEDMAANAEVYVGGKMAVLHSSFNLPEGVDKSWLMSLPHGANLS